MKRQTFLMKSLCVCLSIIMLVSIITLSVSNPAQASGDGKIELHYRTSGDGFCNFDVDDFSDVAQGYYKVKVLVDGTTETYFAIENAPYLNNAYMTIWAFNQIGGMEPVSSFQIAKDTVLEPIDPNNNWATDHSRNNLIMSNTLIVKKENGVWQEEGAKQPEKPVVPEEPEIKKEITTINLGECVFQNNGVFSAYIANIDEVKSAKWYSKPASGTWVDVTGVCSADGTERTLVISIPGNGEIFFWTEEAKKSLQISKGMEFVSADGSFALVFDKNYELDLAENLVYEKGKKPTEKDSIDMGLSYDRMVGESFAFSWHMKGNAKPEEGFYLTDAVIDGKEHKVLIEFYAPNNLFFIYPHCFNEIPSEEDALYPKQTLVLKKGAILTPVSSTSWSKDIKGQPYKLTKKMDIVMSDGVWMDADYKEQLDNMKPVEVRIVFDSVQDRVIILKVVTNNNKKISDLYGDWTTARGSLYRGILNEKTKKYTYGEVQAAYSITDAVFYIDGLALHELDSIRIKKGTILYPESTCKSKIPIMIMNDFGLIRNKDDEWVVDDKFTSYLEPNKDNPKPDVESEEPKENTPIVEQNEEVKTEETINSEENSDHYLASNILFHDERNSQKTFISESKKMIPDGIIVAGIIILLLLGAGAIVLFSLGNKKRNKQQEG